MTNRFDMDAIASHEEDLDIDTLNDSQLYEKLKENNIVAGPIVDSTREIYKKKLKKVLYGYDEESFVSGGEPELVSDKEDEYEIVADEEEETIENADSTGPVMEKEDGEEVVDGVTGRQYESKSDTDDGQPSGVSRPMESAPSGLRKRINGNNAESNEATKEYGADPQPDAKSSSKTSPLVFVMVFLVIVVGAVVAIYFLSADMPGTVDSMQEAANKAASGTDEGEDFTKAANKAASGVDGEEFFTF